MSYIEKQELQDTELELMETEIKRLKEQVKQLTEYNDAIFNRLNKFFKKLRALDNQDYEGYMADDESEIFK